MRQPEDCVITGRAPRRRTPGRGRQYNRLGGIVTSIEPVSRTSGLWIVPAFNAHTHLGDTVAMDIPPVEAWPAWSNRRTV